jgi:hypothetical protein
MATENQQSAQPAPRDSAIMLGALGILAYAASMMTHEALGHGGYCLARGGHNILLTTLGERCSIQPPGIEAAGPSLQFGSGLLAWFVVRRLSPGAARLRYFFWLYMVFNLFVSSGYVVFSGVTDFGDAAVLISGLGPLVAWRSGLILFGSVLYFLSMRAAALELKRFAGIDDGHRRLSRLVWIPYVTAGVFACCAGALNRTMTHGAAIGLAAASSFGGAWGVLLLPDMQRGMAAKDPSPTIYLTLNAAWCVVAGIVTIGFLVTLSESLP